MVKRCCFRRCIDTPSICVDLPQSPDLASSRSEHLHQLPAYRRPVGVASGCRRAERPLRRGGGVPRHPGRPRRATSGETTSCAACAAADVVIAVIGPHWTSAVHEHVGRAVLDPAAEDVLRLEVETALRRNKALIPVLVEGADDAAARAAATDLPAAHRPSRPSLRAPRVVGRGPRRARRRPSRSGRPASTAIRRRPGRSPSGRAGTDGRGASRAAWYMAQGSLVTILGPRRRTPPTAPRRGRTARRRSPDTSELARHLAEWFDIEQVQRATWRASRSTSRSPTGARTCAARCTSCSCDADAAPHLGAPLPGGRARSTCAGSAARPTSCS